MKLSPTLIVSLILWAVFGTYAALADSIVSFLVSIVAAGIAAIESNFLRVCWPQDATAEHDAVPSLFADADAVRDLTGEVKALREEMERDREDYEADELPAERADRWALAAEKRLAESVPVDLVLPMKRDKPGA